MTEIIREFSSQIDSIVGVTGSSGVSVVVLYERCKISEAYGLEDVGSSF